MRLSQKKEASDEVEGEEEEAVEEDEVEGERVGRVRLAKLETSSAVKVRVTPKRSKEVVGVGSGVGSSPEAVVELGREKKVEEW